MRLGIRNAFSSVGKKSWKIWVIALVVAVIGVRWVQWRLEPRYQGKTITEWFDSQTFIIGNLRGGHRDPYLTAIRGMGRKSVPFLLKQVQPSKSALHGLKTGIVNRMFGGQVTMTEDERFYLAFFSLVELGADSGMTPEELVKAVGLTDYRRVDASFLNVTKLLFYLGVQEGGSKRQRIADIMKAISPGIEHELDLG